MVESAQSFNGINQNPGCYYCIDSLGDNTQKVIHSINRNEHFQNLKLIREIFLSRPITEWSW